MIRFVLRKAHFADLNGRGTWWGVARPVRKLLVVHKTGDGSLEYGSVVEG